MSGNLYLTLTSGLNRYIATTQVITLHDSKSITSDSDGTRHYLLLPRSSFRLGKMYRYTVEKFDMASLEGFATGFYKNMKAESVPLPKSPFDDLVQLCVDYLEEYPALFAVMVGIPLVLLAS